MPTENVDQLLLLRDVVTPVLAKLLPDVRAATTAFNESADLLENLDKHIAEADRARAERAEAVKANLERYHSGAFGDGDDSSGDAMKAKFAAMDASSTEATTAPEMAVANE